MDPRLESVDRIMASMDVEDDPRRELAFGILALDENDPATLRWLAAVCAARAAELED